MWLRQVALVAHDLEPVVAELEAVLGLQVAFRDPGVAIFGLVNAVMPVGGEFLEVVQPVKDDASALRYLHRRGGDAGYMLIFEVADALAHRERVLALGARQIAAMDKRYVFTHFHPADFGGVLTSMFLTFNANIGVVFTMKALIVVIMGGVGNLAGALSAGLILGLVETFVATYVSPGLTLAAVYLIFLAILLWRPSGLFGKARR